MIKKYNLIFVFTILSLFISSCNTVKKAFDPERKNSSEEFLVEKKSPLIMPPNFNELPVPKSSNKKNEKNDNTIEDLISKSENKILENKKNTKQDLEKTILEKINE